MSLINLSLEVVYCSIIVAILDSSRDLQANCAMRFLFRLDLILHAGAGKKIRILNFATKQGVRFSPVSSKVGSLMQQHQTKLAGEWPEL